MRRAVVVRYKGKRISIHSHSLSFFGMIRGLMFRKVNTNILFFDFRGLNPSIHSWFVFFPFIAVWLSHDYRVVSVKIVRPFQAYVSPEKKAAYLIEIPAFYKYEKLWGFFVGKEQRFKYLRR